MIKLRPIKTNTALAGYNNPGNVYWEDTYDEKTDTTILDRKANKESKRLHSDPVTPGYNKIPVEDLPKSIRVAYSIEPEVVNDSLVFKMYDNLQLKSGQSIKPSEYVSARHMKITPDKSEWIIRWNIQYPYTKPGGWSSAPISEQFPSPEDLVDYIINIWITSWNNGEGALKGHNVFWDMLRHIAPYLYTNDELLYKVASIMCVGPGVSPTELFQTVKSEAPSKNMPKPFAGLVIATDADEIWEECAALHKILHSPEMVHTIYKDTGEVIE